MLVRPGIIKLLEDGGGLAVDTAVHARLRKVVVEFAHGFVQRLRFVSIGFCDVAKGDKLLKSGLGVGR